MKKLLLITALSICNISIAMDKPAIDSQEHITAIAREQFIDLKVATVKALLGKKNPDEIDFLLMHNEPNLSGRARQDLSNAIAKETTQTVGATNTTFTPKPHPTNALTMPLPKL